MLGLGDVRYFATVERVTLVAGLIEQGLQGGGTRCVVAQETGRRLCLRGSERGDGKVDDSVGTVLVQRLLLESVERDGSKQVTLPLYTQEKGITGLL